MNGFPLAVVINVVVKDGKILLIKRIKGDYVGFWGLPGGKIKKDEHLSEAAKREFLEESGIPSRFKDYLGFVSENLIDEEGNVLEHFLLHICVLEPQSTVVTNDGEGKLEWFSLDSLERSFASIIPSDYLIMEKMVKKGEKNYYNCVIKRNKDKYTLVKFE